MLKCINETPPAQAGNAARRRTTLTLPSDSLAHAERIARARKVNLSVVVSEALSDGLRMHTAAERSEQVLKAYKKAFAGFSDDEMMVLDGIVLEPPQSAGDDKSRMGPLSF